MFSMGGRTKRVERGIRGGLVALAAGCVLGLAGPADAQQPKKGEEVRAPTPGKTDENAPGIMNLLLIAVLAGVVIVASCLPSKRGHQD